MVDNAVAHREPASQMSHRLAASSGGHDFCARGSGPIAAAGLWENWRSPRRTGAQFRDRHDQANERCAELQGLISPIPARLQQQPRMAYFLAWRGNLGALIRANAAPLLRDNSTRVSPIALDKCSSQDPVFHNRRRGGVDANRPKRLDQLARIFGSGASP